MDADGSQAVRGAQQDVAMIPAVPGAMNAAEVVAAASSTDFTSIVGFGSLLSATSAATTCPGVRNFRIGRVRGWRRVFGHPAHIFFHRGIAKPETKEIASLCAEPSEDPGSGFVMAAFEVPTTELAALLEREEEFNFVDVPYYPLNSDGGGDVPVGRGYMCTRATDEEILDKRGHRAKYTEALQESYGFTSIWDQWNASSGLLPTPVYCRHCVLASQKPGIPKEATDSFLDETFLCDRTTTLRDYLATDGAHVMTTEPPATLVGRYSG